VSLAQILMHVEAARRHAVEGPNKSAKKELNAFFAKKAAEAAAPSPQEGA
jgi:hypothetical protein